MSGFLYGWNHNDEDIIEEMLRDPDLYTFDNFRIMKHPKKGALKYDGYN